MVHKVIRHIKQGTLLETFKKYILQKFGDNKKKKAPTKSIAYRSNEESILQGDIPEKYTRILPYVKGERVLDIGAAEGVMSFLLTKSKKRVYALEKSAHRFQESYKVREALKEKGFPVERCELLMGSIDDRLDLLDMVDTVVAIRVIYYFHDANKTLAEIGKKVENVVLGGNAEKVDAYNNGMQTKRNYLSTIEAMKKLLEDNGYEITTIVAEGDPIVVGQKKENRKSVKGD